MAMQWRVSRMFVVALVFAQLAGYPLPSAYAGAAAQTPEKVASDESAFKPKPGMRSVKPSDVPKLILEILHKAMPDYVLNIGLYTPNESAYLLVLNSGKGMARANLRMDKDEAAGRIMENVEATDLPSSLVARYHQIVPGGVFFNLRKEIQIGGKNDMESAYHWDSRLPSESKDKPLTRIEASVDGTTLSIKESINVTSMPKEIMDSVRNTFGGAGLMGLYKLTVNDKVLYGFSLCRDQKWMDVQATPSGQLIYDRNAIAADPKEVLKGTKQEIRYMPAEPPGKPAKGAPPAGF